MVAAEAREPASHTARATDETGGRIQGATRRAVRAIDGRICEISGVQAPIAAAAEETGAAAVQVPASASEPSRRFEHLNAETARMPETLRAA